MFSLAPHPHQLLHNQRRSKTLVKMHKFDEHKHFS